ncbi:MAG: hypothetical protein R3B99_28335 [Polyangiales bacterium]
MISFPDRCRAYAAAAVLPPSREAFDALGAATAPLWRAVDGSSREALEEGAAVLCEVVASSEVHVAAAAGAAIAIGALVERGLSPGPYARTIAARCREALEAAAPFLIEAQAAGDALDETGLEGLDEDALEYVAGRDLPRDVVERIARSMPLSADAYFALDRLCLPTIACLTRDPEARAHARADVAFAEAAAVHRYDFGKWIHQLLVADADAEWIVLDHRSRRGFVVRVEELSENWAIQPLLADALVRGAGAWGEEGPDGGLAGERPSRALVECLQGRGPQSLQERVSGQWEVYTFGAIGPDGSLREGPLEHKVWNEGIPDDIPKVDGRRVLVLGTELVQRSWNACRAYGALGSRMEWVRELTREEVEEWYAKGR